MIKRTFALLFLLCSSLSTVASNTKADSLLLKGATPYYNSENIVETMVGVSVSSYGGVGEGNNLLVRGQSSLYHTTPLYVVNGVICSDIQFLNTLQIEEIKVLSSGLSSAKYGLRGGNGVVEIKTKSVKSAKNSTSRYSGQVGVKSVLSTPSMASTSQYSTALLASGNDIAASIVTSAIELFGSDASTNLPSENSSWFDELLTPSFVQNHFIELSSPTKKGGYLLSMHYYNEDDMISSASGSLTRIGGEFKSLFSPLPRVDIGINMMFNYNNTISGKSPWLAAFTTPTITPAYNENRDDSEAYPIKYSSATEVGLADEFLNPLAVAHYTTTTSDVITIIPTLSLDVDIIEDRLKLSSFYSENLDICKQSTFTGEHSVGGVQFMGENSLYKIYDLFRNNSLNSALYFTPALWRQELELVAGVELKSETWYNIYSYGSGGMGEDSEQHYISQSNSNGRIVSDDGTAYNTLSYFASALYNYDNRYIVSAAIRADGTSKFAKRWVYFPSVGAEWVLSSERFMSSNTLFNTLSIGANYGIAANDRVAAINGSSSLVSGAYTSGVFGNQLYDGYEYTNLSTDLKWEQSSQIEIGANIAMLQNRLTVNCDIYRKVTTSLHYSSKLSMDLGETVKDDGSVENKGVEISLMWSDTPRRGFSYYIAPSLSLQKNQILSLSNSSFQLIGDNFAQSVLAVGSPISSYYGLIQTGVFQTDNLAAEYGVNAGDFSYADIDNNSVIDSNDKVIIGSSQPDGIWNLQLGLRWKKFGFSALLHGEWGAEVLSVINQLRADNQYANYTQSYATGMWSAENGTNSYPSAAGSFNEWNSNLFSSWYLESGTFIEVRNVEINYTLEPKWLSRDGNQGSVVVSLNALNPFYWYKSSIAPQILRNSNADLYATASTFTLGIKINY